MDAVGPALLLLALLLLIVMGSVASGLALRRRLKKSHPERFQRRPGFDVGGLLAVAGMMMLGSVFLRWGGKTTATQIWIYEPNFLTGVLGGFAMMAGGLAAWGRRRSRVVLFGASAVGAIVGFLVAVPRWGNIQEIWDGGGETAIGIWLAFGGGVLALLTGLGGMAWAALRYRTAVTPTPSSTPATEVPSQPPQPPKQMPPPAAPPPPPPAPSWTPTHHVAAAGMPAWDKPDPRSGATTTLDPGLPLRLVERRGDWACVEASNGWQGWVDGRSLVAQAA